MSTATLHSEKKKALIPQLRFPQFEGEWKIDRLLNLTEMIRCGIAATPDYVEVGVPFLSAQNINKDGVISLHKFSFISNEYYKVLSKNHKLLKGDILYSRVGAGYGTAAIFPYNGDFGVYVSLTHIRSNHKLTNPFLKFYLNSDLGKKQASDGVFQGGGVPNLNVKVVEKFKIPFPDIPEQQKIASFLNAVDEKTQQLSRKKELLEQYKKGVMQQLFSGKLRFKDENGKDYPDWEEKKLGECLDYIQPTKYLVSSTEYDNSYNTPVLTAGKTFILGYTNETAGIFKNNLPVIIFDDFTTATQFVDFPFKAKSSAMKILVPFKEVNIKFFYEAMQIMKYEIGGHERHWISKFSQILMPFPCFKEQQKIANFLSSIDAKIESTTQQINQTQSFKKGLLQQLFV